MQIDIHAPTHDYPIFLEPGARYCVGELLPYILHDKKKQAENIITVHCDAPGTFRFAEMLPEEIAAKLEGHI